MKDKFKDLYKALKETDFDLYINILKDILPKYVYRYCEHNNQNIDLIINNQISLSNPQSFNDPFDSLSYTIDPQIRSHKKVFDYMIRDLFANSNDKVVKELLDNILEQNILSQNISYNEKYAILKKERDRIEKKYTEIEIISVYNSTSLLYRFYGFSNKLITDFVSDSAVACFSENRNNFLMWAHYGKGHSGFCIEYSTEDIINRIHKNRLFFFVPVIYDHEIYSDSSYPISGKTMAYLWNLPQFMFKHPMWEYENEWRTVVFNKKNKIIDSYDIKSITLGYNFSVYNKYVSNKSDHDEKSQIDAYIKLMKYAKENEIQVHHLEPQSNVYKIRLR